MPEVAGASRRFPEVPQRLVSLRLPQFFSFFSPNPSYAFITTVTRWRSVVPGGSWRLLEVREVPGGSTASRLAAPSPTLFFFFPPQPVLCLYNHGDQVEERSSWRFLAAPRGSRRLPEVPGGSRRFYSVSSRCALPNSFLFFPPPTRPMPL